MQYNEPPPPPTAFTTLPPPLPGRRGSRLTLWYASGAIMLMLLGCLLLCGVQSGSSTGSDDARKPAQISAPAAPQTPSATPTTAAAVPAGPATTISSSGTFLVGTDIAPGQYRANVDPSDVGCYWARLRSTSGQFSDIIANGIGEPGGQVVVTIAATDKAFQSVHCGRWEKIG